MSKKRIILLGEMGVGKTSLFNEVTSSNEDVQEGGASVTQHLILKTSTYGAEFDVMDTPGFGSEKNVLLHSAKIIAALTEGPVHQIFLVVAYTRRTELIVRKVKELFICCKHFSDLVTVILTHWEFETNDMEKRKKYQQEIEEAITKHVQIKSFIFTSKKDQNQQQSLCLQINKILEKSEGRKLEFTQGTIYQQFQLIQVKADQEDEISQQRLEIKNKFHRVALKYLNFIKDFPINEYNLVDVMQAVTLNIKLVATNQIDEFQKGNGNQLNQLYDETGKEISYLHDIILKKEIWPNVIEIAQKAQEKIKESGTLIFENLKKCPNCNLIWLMVDKCSGKVTCGDVPKQKIDDVLHQETIPTKIIFLIENDKLVYKYLSQEEQLKQIEQQEVKKKVEKQKKSWFWRFSNLFHTDDNTKKDQKDRAEKEQKAINISQVRTQYVGSQKSFIGCGKTFYWAKQPPLDQFSLKFLTDTNLVDFFSKGGISELEILAQGLEQVYQDTLIQEIGRQRQGIIKHR